MADQELLEAAAKAGGIDLLWHSFSKIPSLWEGLGSDTVWTPLTDDGDALRLAVKLGLNIMQQPDCAEPWVDICGPDVEADELYGTDPYAATRRAIVRAAAEIGRSMK